MNLLFKEVSEDSGEKKGLKLNSSAPPYTLYHIIPTGSSCVPRLPRISDAAK